jgi:anti-sigma B factor antagonist
MWNPFVRKIDAPVPVDEFSVREGLQTSDVAPQGLRNKIAEVERIGPTAVATLTVTELTQEQGVSLLADLLDDLAESGARHFVLDIQNVQFMDSACLGCLVEALNRMAAKGGGRIALANTAHSVQYLFRMTQLDRVFPICGDVLSALAAVEKEPEPQVRRKLFGII